MMIAVFIIAVAWLLWLGWRKRRVDVLTAVTLLLLALLSFGQPYWSTAAVLQIVTDGAEPVTSTSSLLDLRGLTPAQQQQRLLGTNASKWQIHGDGFESDVLAGLNLPMIDWQTAAAPVFQLPYQAYATERAIWTLRWQQTIAADRVQLRNAADQLLAEKLVTQEGELSQATLAYQFNAEGIYPSRLKVFQADALQAEYPVMVSVTAAPEFAATLRFSAPSFEWRAAKAWLEQADIPFQSRVQIGKQQFREDRSVSTAKSDAQRLQLVDWRYWQTLPSNVQQQQRQALLDGEIRIVFSGDVDDEASARNSLRLALQTESSDTVWQSGNADYRYFSLPVGKGAILWLAEPQWHRIWQRFPDRYAAFMAERIAELVKREQAQIVNHEPLLAGRAQSLCFDNATQQQLTIEVAPQRWTVPLQDASWPGRRCATFAVEQETWMQVSLDQQRWSQAVLAALPLAQQRSEKHLTMSRLVQQDEAAVETGLPWRWLLSALIVALLMLSWWRANRRQ